MPRRDQPTASRAAQASRAGASQSAENSPQKESPMNMRVDPHSIAVAICPAASLVGQLAAADAEFKELDALWDRDDLAQRKRDRVNNQIGEVLDLEDRLMCDAEYVTPTTARGATLLVVLMGRAARAALAPDEMDETPDKAMRRFYRLQAQLLRYFSAETGETVDELGLRPFHFDGGSRGAG